MLPIPDELANLLTTGPWTVDTAHADCLRTPALRDAVVDTMHHRSAHAWPFHEYLILAARLEVLSRKLWIRLERDVDVEGDPHRISLLATILFDAPAADRVTFATRHDDLLGSASATFTKGGTHEISTLHFSRKKPTVENVLRLARVASLSAPYYRLNTFNCWFYSRTILDILQSEYEGVCQVRLAASAEDTYRALRMAGPITRVEQLIHLRFISMSSHDVESLRDVLCHLPDGELETTILPGAWLVEENEAVKAAVTAGLKTFLLSHADASVAKDAPTSEQIQSGPGDGNALDMTPDDCSCIIIACSDLVRTNPGSTGAHAQLGYAYHAAGALRLAELAFKKGLDLDPENMDLQRGLMMVITHMEENATRSVDEPVKPANFAMAEEHRIVGHTHMSADNYEASIDSYTTAIALFPSNPGYYLNRSAAYSSIGDLGNAARDADAAHTLRRKTA